MTPPIKRFQFLNLKLDIDFHKKKIWSYYYKPENYNNKIWFSAPKLYQVIKFLWSR